MTEQEARLAILVAMISRDGGPGGTLMEVAPYVAAAAKIVMGPLEDAAKIPDYLRINKDAK